ncbi:MAG: MBL fold metallo-hydrolase [Chloroflexi bacterium]|nr:MBL fold metallo-hydrolase [Chloroflexota bacterium]
MKVADGVFQLQVPIPRRGMTEEGGLPNTLTYLVEEPGGWVLIDAGWNDDKSFHAFQKQLAAAGLAPRDIRWLVITHHHWDHVGLARRIKEFTGARLVMHERDVRWAFAARLNSDGTARRKVRDWMVRQGVPPQDLAAIFRGHRWAPPVPEVDVDVRIADRETPIGGSPTLRALHTPGHTAGHLCLYDSRRRLLFSGDHLLPEITPNISLFPMSRANPLGAYLESLRRVASLEADTVLPAHQWTFSNLRQRAEEIAEHHEARLREMLNALGSGPRTAYQVAASIAWNVGPWHTLGLWTRMSALFETMAHLRLLERRGEVREVADEDSVVYVRSG